MNKPRVLIVCTGNSARSQMAEALMNRSLGKHIDVVSAGLDPKPLNPLAVQVMNEIGIDISHQYSKDLRDYLGQYFVYLITVCSNAEARCPIFPGVVYRLFWPFDDPAAVEGTDEFKLQEFRRIRDEISDRIQQWVTELKRDQIIIV